MKRSRLVKTETFLRFLALLFAAATAALIGSDTQTKTIFFSEKRATFKDIPSIVFLVIVSSITAGYNLIQLCKCLFFGWYEGNQIEQKKSFAWLCFTCDQVMAYTALAANCAAAQSSVLALTGENQFQWMKVCNVYGRFCRQIGGGLICGLVVALLMALLSSISAFTLFRRESADKLPLEPVTK